MRMFEIFANTVLQCFPALMDKLRHFVKNESKWREGSSKNCITTENNSDAILCNLRFKSVTMLLNPHSCMWFSRFWNYFFLYHYARRDDRVKCHEKQKRDKIKQACEGYGLP